MNEQELVIALCRFLNINPGTVSVISPGFIEFVYKKLSATLWNDYINELHCIMLNDVEEHLPLISNCSLDNGKCILLFLSSNKQKAQALVNAIYL